MVIICSTDSHMPVRTYAVNSPGPPNQLTVDDYVRCGTNSYNVVKMR